MTVRFLAVAQAELHDAIGWYNGQAPQLGGAFLVEIVKSLRLVERHPAAWQKLAPSIHRCRLARFPYGVIYTLDGSDILVLAVAHLHRAPNYWRDRVVK